MYLDDTNNKLEKIEDVYLIGNFDEIIFIKYYTVLVLYMNDKEIRLKLLFAFYDAIKNDTEPPLTKKHPALENISMQEWNFNTGYLVDKGLLRGENTVVTGGHVLSSASRITASGIDLVEDFIDNQIEELKSKKYDVPTSSVSTIEKITELLIIWSKNPELYQQAWDALQSLIS